MKWRELLLAKYLLLENNAPPPQLLAQGHALLHTDFSLIECIKDEIFAIFENI